MNPNGLLNPFDLTPRFESKAVPGSNPAAILRIENLSIEYRLGGRGPAVKKAVDRLNLSVCEGEVFGFLGPNGVGKTTTMNVLLGFTHATSGDAFLFGTTVREPIARQRIGYLPELTYYYKFLSAEELLRFYARILAKLEQPANHRSKALALLERLKAISPNAEAIEQWLNDANQAKTPHLAPPP
jgi:ABC-2 type transport system ATP-binding protein